MLGAMLFFALRDGFFLNWKKLRQTAAFAVVLILPGFAIFLLNKAMSGESTAITRLGFQFNSIGFRQFWNALAPPISDASGWARIAFRYPKLQGLSEVISAVMLGMVLINWSRNSSLEVRRVLILLVTMSLSVGGFLIFLTVIYGNFFDWTSEPRYYAPVYVGWAALCLKTSIASDMGRPALTVLRILCGVPLIYGAAATAMKPVLQPATLVYSESRLGAVPDLPPAAADQIRAELDRKSRRPNLVIGNPILADELRLPALPWYQFAKYDRLYASTPQTVWAVLDKGDTDMFLGKLQGARLDKSEMLAGSRLYLTEVNFGNQ
jgi:hypothetical protein